MFLGRRNEPPVVLDPILPACLLLVCISHLSPQKRVNNNWQIVNGESGIRFQTIRYRSATTSRFLQFFDLLAAKAGQFHRILHLQQTVKRRSNDVVRVGGTKNLGTAIMNPDSL